MNLRIPEMPHHVRGALGIITALLFVLGAPRSALSQWTVGDTLNAWNGYNSWYLYQQNGYDDHFATTKGGTTPGAFWIQAEEIELAEDAYVWAQTNDPNNLANYKNEIQGLCDGFVQLNGDDWSSNIWNDDLNVATIAFGRAYQITGTTRWLTDAENNFATVWGRAQAGDGGLCEKQSGCYENSSANWTFVIAGKILYNITGTASYTTEAQGVYNWAKANLWNSTTGQIYDAKGGVTGQYTYNYGFAIGAAYIYADTSSGIISSASNYVMNNLTNYAGTTSGGYNILPNYGQGATDNNGGYNGILMRYLGDANKHGYISSAVLAAAQANATQAWSVRVYPGYIMWNNWASPPPSGTSLYSWDASSGMAALFDIPSP